MPALRKDVVAPLWHARTVEGDLGMRWNAEGVIEAATAEHLLDTVADPERLTAYAARCPRAPRLAPRRRASSGGHDLELARARGLVAVRRHARPARPTESARPLRRRQGPRRVRAACCATPTPPAATTCWARSWPTTPVAGRCRGGARDGRHGIPALRRRPPRHPRHDARPTPLSTPTSPARWPPKPSNRRKATYGRLRPSRGHDGRSTVERPRVVASRPSKGHVWSLPRRRVATRLGSSTPLERIALPSTGSLRDLSQQPAPRPSSPHGSRAAATRPDDPSLPRVGGPRVGSDAPTTPRT